MTAPAALPDLAAYRRFVVAFSGGTDSLAALLHRPSLGVPADAIELHHYDVDGHGPTFMDCLRPRERHSVFRADVLFVFNATWAS